MALDDQDDTGDILELKASELRLSKDLIRAASTMSDEEARYLVDAYYIHQEARKRLDNQILSMKGEPHGLITWHSEISSRMEQQIKRTLEIYSNVHAIGRWMKSNYGIGPVIAAGLMAHIDIEKSPTAGHIWSFAGYNPESQWLKGEKRPWNADLKTLCWKVGQSFMKFHKNEKCFYGHLYRKRKDYEEERNNNGGNSIRCGEILKKKNYGKTTEAFKHYSSGKLPPAHIDAQARRYAVKIFLSHLQLIWWFCENGQLPPKPYASEHLGHAHLIYPPNTDTVENLDDALRRWR